MNKFEKQVRKDQIKSIGFWLLIWILALGTLFLSISHASNGRVSVPAKNTIQKCGMFMRYNKNGHACEQEKVQIKRKKADNFQIGDHKIFRR